MLVHLHLAARVGFAGLMTVAAVEDLRRLTVPNSVIIGFCALWHCYLAPAPNAAWAADACAVVLGGALLFARGLVGGGDVKLLAAAGLWAGPNKTLPFLIVTGLLGGLLALLFLIPFATMLAEFGWLNSSRVNAAAPQAPSIVVPYGIAIAAAGVIVTTPSNFS